METWLMRPLSKDEKAEHHDLGPIEKRWFSLTI